ncbi:MAG: glucose-6-phosphate dehydrogenase assembly protein OpcA [Propionicimonas sp.]
MIIDLPDTSAADIGQRILSARSAVGLPTGMVFTLIAVAEGCSYDEVLAASIEAGREHPSRILVVTNAPGDTRLDAQLRLGEDVPGDIISLVFHGDLVSHRASVLLPLVLPDSSVVVWWPGMSPAAPGRDPIGSLAVRRITDAMGAVDPVAALVERALHYAPGDLDLSWTRLTKWRGLLAASLDHYRAPVRSVQVSAAPRNPAGLLLAAWLDDRLGVEVSLIDDPAGIGITGVVMQTDDGEIRLSRTDGTMAAFSAPGLPRRLVALPRQQINSLITEELRRLDEDAAYSATMARLAGRWRASDPRRSEECS